MHQNTGVCKHYISLVGRPTGSVSGSLKKLPASWVGYGQDRASWPTGAMYVYPCHQNTCITHRVSQRGRTSSCYTCDMYVTSPTITYCTVT